MAIYAGANLVTNGLVLHLDAANIRSYVGSGTNFSDLSGTNNNGTLTNGVSFSSADSGSLSLDGTDDYVSISGTSGFPFGASAGTICAWARRTGSINTGAWIMSYGTASSGQSRFIGIVGGVYLFGSFGDATTFITASGPVLNTWFNMVGVYTGTTALIYINGKLVSGPTATTWNTVASTVQLGRQTNGSEYWGGNIAQISVYNRALSAAEVLQNYNTTRSRFGLQ